MKRTATTSWHARAKSCSSSVGNYINGTFVECRGHETVEKISAIDGRMLYAFKEGDGSEVDLAVAAARESFKDGRWSGLAIEQRRKRLMKLAGLIDDSAEELALLETLDVGKPISSALSIDVPAAARSIESAANGVENLFTAAQCDGRRPNLAYQVRKPVGVVGAIVGWNFPLGLACTKAAPALAMGNSIVLKPSEFTPRSACRLAELALEADIPPGVFNVVQGTGRMVGDRLARHRDVDLLSFTGSTATGKKLLVSSGRSNMKRLMLECGGKSPFIVFEDAPQDVDALASVIASMAFANQGQVCSAGTRLLVHESRKDALLTKLVGRARGLVPGDPLDSATAFGAMMSHRHMARVVGYIDGALDDGARLLCGGERVLRDSKGAYLSPAIFDEVDPESRLAQEEVFGPVLCVFTFRTEEEAIHLANHSPYGLAAYAATNDAARVLRLGRRLDTGVLMIVTSATMDSGAGFYGFEPVKQSGYGAEHGLAGLESYSVTCATIVHG